MGEKPSYIELEQRIKELEKLAVTYSQAKASLRETLEKHPDLEDNAADPEMAVDVLDQEITEQKPVEQAFIAEHIFRKAIEKSVPCGVAAMDLKGRQTYVNQFFCRMVGWKEEDLLGAKFPFTYLSIEEINCFWDHFSRPTYDPISDKSFELQLRRKNGDRFWGLVQTATLHDSEGQRSGLLMSVVDITRQKQAEEKLRAMSSSLIDAQETERKHISTELHDSIGGKLTGIKYSLEKALYDVHGSNASQETPLPEILAIVQDTIEETQRITKNLHPSILDDLGILSAIRSFCREFQDIYSNICINLNFDFEERQIPESLKILIYRVMQEALNNVAKHSGAETIDLTLEQVPDRFILSIRDNGNGFDLEKVMRDEDSQSMGLRSMNEKTELFGGSLRIETAPGNGTLVQAAWPSGCVKF